MKYACLGHAQRRVRAWAAGALEGTLTRLIDCRRLALVAGALLLMGVASAQTRTIRPYKTFTVPRKNTINTASFVPQIQQTQQLVMPTAAMENDYTPRLPLDPPNNLVAGSSGLAPRGSVKSFFPGPTDLRWFPPDCNMAVGPNHIVTVINSTIAFYSKAGAKTFQVTMDGPTGFFNGTAQTSFVFDPKCFYDPISNRFFVIALDLDEGSTISNALIAVSDDNNPNGTWFKYRVNAILNQGGTNYWLDYPGFGFNKDAVVVTGNMFGIGGGYFGVQALVLKKAPMLTGGTVTASVLLDPGVGTVQPTRTAQASADKIYAVAVGGGAALRFYAFTSLTGTPVMSQVNVAVPGYGFPGGPAPSGGNVLDTLDGRIMTAHARGNHVVAAHTISAGGNPHVVRWYDIQPGNWPTSGTPTLGQSGNISEPGAAIHMPAVNINSFEDISVFYTRSSSSIPSDLCFSSRFKTDPAGSMGAPVKLIGSTTAQYTAVRWGDYFGNEIDPLDDTTFWGFGMITGAGGAYETHILKWVVTPPGPVTGTPIPADSISTYMGNFVFGTVADIQTSNDIFFQIASVPYSTVGQAAGADVQFTVPTTTSVMSVEVEAIAGITGGTTNVWMLNWNSGQYELVGSAPIPASGNTSKVINVPTTKIPRYVGPGGTVMTKIRGHIPLKPFGVQPSPFTYRIDLFRLMVR